MSPLEQQHAAEALSLVDLATIGFGGFLFVAVVTIGKGLLADRRARQRRMEDRAFDAWQRDMDARAQQPEHMSWAEALDFPWPSEIAHPERRTLRIVEPSDRTAA